MDRESAVKVWEKAQTEGLWHVPWSKAVEGLSASQAAWKPHPDRHSIWQNANHVIFWREYLVRLLAGNKPGKEEVERRNWEEPGEVSEGAWAAAVRRLADSHRQILETVPASDEGLKRLPDLIAHDSYHIGQIMYVRALQGLPPIDD